MKKIYIIFATVLLSYLAFMIIVSSVALAETNSEEYNFVFPYDRSAHWLYGEGHPGRICMQCHDSLLEKKRSRNMGCLCHYTSEDGEWRNVIDIQDIKRIHGNGPCVRCHIGQVSEIEKDDIHTVHIDKTCEVCHIKEELLILPDTTDCNFCHESGPHSIHEKELNKLCVLCHGKYGWENTDKSYSILGNDSGISAVSKKETGVPTIANVIRVMFNSVLEALW